MAHIARDGAMPSGDFIVDQYQDQYDRGSKGFGLIEIGKGSLNVRRSTEPVKALLDARMSKAPVLAFHHRQPTSSENTRQQTHPIRVSHDELGSDYLIIHNGVIRNESELFRKHTKELGYAYTTFTGTAEDLRTGYSFYRKFNDSESFAIELARYLEKRSEEIGARGSAAFIAVRVNKQTGLAEEILWGKNDTNPLDVLETKHGLLIASDIRSEYAESIRDFHGMSISLGGYFNANKPSNRMIKDLAVEFELSFAKDPAPAAATLYSRDRHYAGYSTAGAYDPRWSQDSSEKEEETEESKYAGYTKRETAFVKMAERLTEEVSEEIGSELHDIFLRMSDYPIDKDSLDDLFEFITEDARDRILAKEEVAASRIRPHFDKEEAEEEAREAEAAGYEAMRTGADDEREQTAGTNTPWPNVPQEERLAPPPVQANVTKTIDEKPRRTKRRWVKKNISSKKK